MPHFLMSLHTQIFRLFLMLSLSLVFPAWAEKADRFKPMNVEADALKVDDVKQISLFTGNVIGTKGTLIFKSERLEVKQDREGFQFGTLTGAAGKRAFFRQKREGVDEWMEGEAEIISYDGKADFVTLSKNAVMRRYRGATLADETQGAIITYDNVADVFSVSGGVHSGSGAPGTPASGRIKAVLSPRPQAASSAPSSNTTPPANLRNSTTLGDRK